MQGVSLSKRPALRCPIPNAPCISLVPPTRGPIADHDWIPALFAIRLPLYPRLGIRLKTQFARESVHSVVVGEVNFALVTAPPQDALVTAVAFAPAPLYAVLPEDHPAANKESLLLQDQEPRGAGSARQVSIRNLP
jgi:DNA-binding transcriptional LysR family regulator